MSKDYKTFIERKLKTTKVSEVMSRFAITTRESTTLAELAHLMMRFKISGVPITTESEEVAGIVTATDLFNMMNKILLCIEEGGDPKKLYDCSVKDIMTKDIFCVEEDMTLFDAIKLMCDRNIHTVPVMNGKDIIGIVGRRDVINSCYTLVEEI